MAARPEPVTLTGAISPIAAGQRYLKTVPDGARVMIALSGGGDSVGLLAALLEARRNLGRNVDLCAATVDHRLRAGSADEAAAMELLCVRHRLAHRTLAWDAKKPGSGISEAARQARYDLLVAAAREFEADVIVTGHTLNDQLETVEMRRKRRDGGKGLAGMASSTLFGGSVWVDRPFLEVERADIRGLLTRLGLSWFEDPSNENAKYERVRLRQAGAFQIGAEQVRQLAADRRNAAEAAADYLSSRATMPLPLLFRIELDDQIDSEAARLAIACLNAIAGGRAFVAGEAQLQRLWAILNAGDDFRHSLGRTVLERRKQALYMGRDGRDLPGPFVLKPGEQVLWDGRFLAANRGSQPVLAELGGDVVDVSGIPARVAARALKTAPGRAAGLEVNAYLAPFERILPDFEFTLANAIAKLCARRAFPLHC